MSVASRSVCFLVRTKDRPIFLARALKGMIGQTDQDWSVAIVNDGGEKSALDSCLAPFLDSLKGRLELVHFEKSEGRGKGVHLNAAISSTRSEFLVVHDDDDSLDPRFLERAKAAIGAKAAVVTQSVLVKEKFEGDKIVELSREPYEPWQKNEISLFRLAENLSFPPVAMLFRRSVSTDLGHFRDDLGPLEDWEFALRLFSRYAVEFLEEPLAFYHQREANAAGPGANSRLNSAQIYAKLDRQIRNELLRDDLRTGKMGLGYLVNLAERFGRVVQELEK